MTNQEVQEGKVLLVAVSWNVDHLAVAALDSYKARICCKVKAVRVSCSYTICDFLHNPVYHSCSLSVSDISQRFSLLPIHSGTSDIHTTSLSCLTPLSSPADMPRNLPKRKDSGCDVDMPIDNETMWASVQMLWKTQMYHLDVFQRLERSVLPRLFDEAGVDRILRSLQVDNPVEGKVPCEDRAKFEEELPKPMTPALKLARAHLSTLLGAKIPEYMEEDGYLLPVSPPSVAPTEDEKVAVWFLDLMHLASVIGDRCRFSSVDAHLSAFLPSGCGMNAGTFGGLVERDIHTKSCLERVGRAHGRWAVSLQSFQDRAEEYWNAWQHTGKGYTGHDMQTSLNIASMRTTVSELTLTSPDEEMDEGGIAVGNCMMRFSIETSFMPAAIPDSAPTASAHWSGDDTASLRPTSPVWGMRTADSPESTASFGTDDTELSTLFDCGNSDYRSTA